MPTISQCVPDDPLDKRLGTDGRPNPGVEVRIVDDAGTIALALRFLRGETVGERVVSCDALPYGLA